MKKLNKYIVLLLLNYFAWQNLWSQNVTLHVVTQTTQKEWTWQANKSLVINGENAQITVEAWDKNTIQATIDLIAKHPQKEMATRDVAAQKAILKENNNSFLLGNQLVLEKGMKKPVSNLKASYTVYAPKNCALQIKNKFGKIKVVGIKNTVTVNSQFTKLDLTEVKGKVKLTSNFGDISGKKLEGQVHIDANRSDIQLVEPLGDFTIKAKYGLVTILENSDRRFDLTVKGDKANVLFVDPVLLAHNFRLTTEFGDIKVPPQTDFKFTEHSGQGKAAVLKSNRNASQISVDLSYGDITIQK
ncbi:MAG: DUF4097 family beta strand repeat-containing protein [Bacteroidota bacterium]